MKTLSLLLGALGALASSTSAQTVFNEVEPNSSKAEAMLVSCMTAGDSIIGMTTGSTTTTGYGGLDSADYFLVQTCPLPPGIYKHRLVFSSGLPTFGYTASVRGLQQSYGTISNVEVNVEPLNPLSTSERFLQWYGFGRSEQLYIEITGTANTTGSYMIRLETTAVTPVVLPAPFLPGTISIDANGHGHTTDTDLWVYDGGLHAIPGFGNDDPAGTSCCSPSRLVRTFAGGTYYVAIATFDVVNEMPSAPDEGYSPEPVLDFPNAILHNSSYYGVPHNCTFGVDDGHTSQLASVTETEQGQLLWVRFEVTSTTSIYCVGDGFAVQCPCGNNSQPSDFAGCANSLGLGGQLTASGTASVTGDSFTLYGAQLPNSSALYFQGTMQVNGGIGVPFGDGLRCAGGATIRLGTKTNFANSSQYPETGDTPISQRGMIPNAGGTRDYQVWYRNAAAFCTPATFNLTNGLEVTWSP